MSDRRSIPHVLVASLAALAVGVTPLGAARAAAVPASGPTGVAAPRTAERAEMAAAAARARQVGHRVEVAGLRSQTGQVFANPSGSFTAEEYALPVRVRRADGSWAAVDTSLRRAADGSVVPVASPAGLRLSGGGEGPVVEISRDGAALALGWPGRLPEPVLAGDVATYPEVLPGVDLRVRSLVDGFSEVLVVKDRAAAANPALRRIRFALRTTGVSVRSTAGGSLAAVDASGRQVFGSGTAMMWDSRAAAGAPAVGPDSAPAPGTEPGRGARRAAMRVETAPGALTVTPDQDLLTGPGTVFPVFIDPSTTVGSTWTMINQRHPDQSYWSYDRTNGAKVGYVEELYNGDGWERYRSIFAFSTANFDRTHVLGAEFSAYLYHSYSCTASRTDLWLTGAINSGTDWNNHAGSWSSNLANVTNQSCNGARIFTEWGGAALTSTTQTAANGWSSITLGLKANNESTINAGWKKFDPATAKLAVTYNSVPATPGNPTSDGKPCVVGSGRPFVGTLTPIMRVLVSDPDGGLLTNWWAWTRINSDGSYNSSWVGDFRANLASGSTAQLATSALVNGASYAWHAQTNDGVDAGPVSGWCEFTVDTTRPDKVPDVVSADGIYVDDGDFHGGVGRPGTFRLSAGGVTDVTAYRYGLADPPTTRVTTSTLGGSATVGVTPTAAGITTLYVRSEDRAGNLSDIKRYIFFTGSATPPIARYTMDEGTGTLVNDTSGNGRPGASLTGGASWTAGRVGVGGPDKALAFNGSTGYAATSAPLLDTSKSFAVAAWVRLNSNSTYRTALSQDGVHSGAFYLQSRPPPPYDNGSWSFTFGNSDGGSVAGTTVASSGVAPALGQWTHVAGVYDAGAKQIRVFVNGIQKGATTVNPHWNATGPFAIGRAKANDNLCDFFPGDIDDVRVWDRAVYADELTRVVNASTLVGQWTFDEMSGTTTADSSGYGHTATLNSGATWTTGHDGGGAINLNGTSGAVVASSPALRTDNSFTVTAWAKPSLHSGYRTVLSQDGAHTSVFYLQYRQVPPYDTGAWSFITRAVDSDTQPSTGVGSGVLPVVGQWVHLAGVYDRSAATMRIYVNGQLKGSASNMPSFWNATGPLVIGRAKSASTLVDYFPGAIDDVRVYSGVLSDAQIAALALQ